MAKQYSFNFENASLNASDLRRLSPDRRTSAEKLAARAVCRRYGVSASHAKLIAELHYGGRSL